MESPRVKRRKLGQEECAGQQSLVNDGEMHKGGLTVTLLESTELIAHRLDVCFGMVRVEAKSLKPDALGANGEDFVEISLNLEGNQLITRNIMTQEYGGLLARQHQSTLVLEKLNMHHNVTLRAWLIRTNASTRKKPIYELFIVVYGMEDQKDAVGDALDGAEMFLQDPPDRVRGDHSVPYFNPHRLYNPALDNGVNPPLKLAPRVPVKIEKQQKSLCDADPLKQRVREVMDSACGPRYFVANQQSPRIRISLKQHQMKALSMMVEKESGDIENNVFGSVWKAIDSHGSIKYKNTVTGSVQTDFPKLSYGGILADDMGLGKTLTAISLIAISKDSIDFAAEHFSSPQTTLVVTPLSLLQTWEEQLLNHVHHGQLSYCTYYGAFKGDVSSLTKYDIVLTTYDTVSKDASKKKRDTIAGLGIGSIEWLRVILDEAHVIRNRSTQRFRAIHALKARFRWCLTGTPIFNRVEDFGSLMGFTGVYPFDSSSTFNSRITNPVIKRTPNGLETLRKLVHATSLRRTKDSINEELRLPGRGIVQEEVKMTEEEQKNYDVLKSSYASILQEDDEMNAARRSTASIMQTIARLRQFCDHGLDLLPRKVHQLFDDSMSTERASWNLFDALEACAVCQKPVNGDNQDQDSLDCGHYLCSGCQKKNAGEEIPVDIVCKVCDQDPGRSGSSTPYPFTHPTAATSDYVPSSKVQALLRNLVSERQNSSCRPIKSVVFSCWTKMLDLIQKAMAIQGLDFVRIDGRKTEKARREAIARFRGDPNCGILLATIGSAGVGLDLTVASRVHIIEPQWTQTAENQAIDRVHRLGQTQDVIATRYIVKNSIEEYVLTVQDRKAAVMHQAFETDGVENVMSARERLLQYLA